MNNFDKALELVKKDRERMGKDIKSVLRRYANLANRSDKFAKPAQTYTVHMLTAIEQIGKKVNEVCDLPVGKEV